MSDNPYEAPQINDVPPAKPPDPWRQVFVVALVSVAMFMAAISTGTKRISISLLVSAVVFMLLGILLAFEAVRRRTQETPQPESTRQQRSRSLIVFAFVFVGCAVAFPLAGVDIHYTWSMERVLLSFAVAIVAMIIDEKVIRKN